MTILIALMAAVLLTLLVHMALCRPGTHLRLKVGHKAFGFDLEVDRDRPENVPDP